jgi:hypothetical protein
MRVESAPKLVEVAPAVHAMFMASEIGPATPCAGPHHFHGMLLRPSMDHVDLASAAVTDRHIAKSCTPNSGDDGC